MADHVSDRESTKLKDLQNDKTDPNKKIEELTAKATTITLMSAEGHSRLKLKSIESDGDGDTLAAYRPTARSQKPNDFNTDSDPIDSLIDKAPAFDIERQTNLKVLNLFGLVVTFAWLGMCYLYIQNTFGLDVFSNLKPHEFGGFLAGVIAPVAVFWIIIAYIMRGSDVKLYAQALRGELHSLIFPTEERAARVHEDIEHLVQQSSEMALASKAVLKSIHRARQGLRAEMKEFATLAKKGEFHLVRLSESLEKRGEHLLKLTEEIEQRTQNIDKTTKEGASAWDEATQDILNRTAEIETSLIDGAQRILDASEEARVKSEGIQSSLDTTYDNLGLKVDDISEKMDSLSGQFDVHAERLGKATDKVSDTTDALSDLLDRQLDDLDSLASKTLSAIAQASENSSQKQQALVDGTQELIERAEKAANTVEAQIGGIYSAADHVTSTFKDFEISVQEQADKLSGSVDGLGHFVQKIEDTGDEALTKLNEAVTSALSTTENMSVTVRRSAETIKKATEEAQRRSDTLIQVSAQEIEKLEAQETAFSDKISGLTESFTSNLKEIESAKDKTEELTQNFDISLKAQYELITDAREALEGTINRMSSGVERPLESVNKVISELDKRQTYLEETLTKRTSALNEASQKALDTTFEIKDAMRGEVQDIASMTGQISGHAQTIISTFKDQQDAIEKTVSQYTQGLEAVGSNLSKQEDILNRSSKNSIENISALSDSLSSKYENLSKAQSKSETEFNTLIQSLEDKTAQLDDLSSKTREGFVTIQTSLEESFSSVEPIYTDVISQSQEAKSHLETLNKDITSEFESVLEQLQNTGIVFEKQSENLKDGALEATDVLKTVNKALESNTHLIIQAVDDTQSKTQSLIQDFENKAEDIHITADQATIKIDTLQKSLSEQVNTLSNYVGQSVSLIETAEKGFVSASDTVKDKLDTVVVAYDKASDKAMDEAKILRDIANDTLDHVDEVVLQLKKQSQSLLDTTEDNLSALKQNGDHFAVRAMELEAQMKGSLDTTKEFGVELRKQAAELGQAGHDAADQIAAAVSQLSSESSNVSAVSEKSTEDAKRAGEALAKHANDLKELSDKALTVADEAAYNFAKHSDALAKSAQDALGHVRSIQDAEAKVQKDAFFTGAKFIIESLHSLSVDITRHLGNGDVSDKLWKIYEKGDLGVFTNRLSEANSIFDEGKIREKFSNDHEFRTYVQRYMRQFEELFEQAEENDHGALLSATFIASDVGKLYMKLCSISGRTPKTER